MCQLWTDWRLWSPHVSLVMLRCSIYFDLSNRDIQNAVVQRHSFVHFWLLLIKTICRVFRELAWSYFTQFMPFTVIAKSMHDTVLCPVTKDMVGNHCGGKKKSVKSPVKDQISSVRLAACFCSQWNSHKQAGSFLIVGKDIPGLMKAAKHRINKCFL